MVKPTVYVETTIAGHLTSRFPKDSKVTGEMNATREWWNTSRSNYDCYTSEAVLNEAGRGDPQASAERLQLLADLPLVKVSGAAVDQLATLLLQRHALPVKARSDAVHLATAAVAGMFYLLTWNCRHLANVTLRARIEQTCRDCGYEPPFICTPAELNEVSP